MGKFLMIICLFLHNYTLLAQSHYLFTYTEEKNVGDRNQALGIADALRRLSSEIHFQEKTSKVSDKHLFLQDIEKALAADQNNKVIIIAAGVPTIETLTQIPLNMHTTIVYSAHQLTPEHDQLKDIANIITLPKHAITAEQIKNLTTAKTEVITTSGVAHNSTSETILAEYEKNKDSIPKASGYIGVILGGDAPTAEGNMLYYTPEEAVELAKYLHESFDLNTHCLLIVNGPRTGKHNPQNEYQPFENSHKNETLDFVTAAFVEQLKQYGYTENQNFKLFDFQYDKPSFYKPVLGALSTKGGQLFVGGESTSMVSEAADCLDAHSVTAYFNTAMNPNHINHCTEENKAGKIDLLVWNAQTKRWKVTKASSLSLLPPQPAAETIAKAILQKHLSKPGLNA